jgi:uncharacterized repeat protein (TIGR01451 family)
MCASDDDELQRDRKYNMASNTAARTDRGQAFAEFALIILVLMFLIFVIVEGARILQANLTAQNAARAAGRYAITGQFDPSCLSDTPPCEDPRVASIKAEAIRNLAGLPLDDSAVYEDPNYYLVEVIGTDENGNQIPDYAGAPGMPVMVRVTYRVGMVTPLTQPIANTVRVIGQVVMNNEHFSQVNNANKEAPELAPFPTAGASPTPIPPDLQITKSDSVDPAVVGEPFEYVIEVVNVGQVDANNVEVVDQLPAGITYLDGPVGCSYNSGVVTCSGFNIPANTSRSLTLEVEPELSVADSTVTNEATVNLAGDPDTSNNTDTETTEIVHIPTDADLQLAKNASATLIATGDELVYVVGVFNHGLATANNVVVTDILPAGVSFVSATVFPSGSCDAPQGNTLTCNLGTIERDGNASVSIRVATTQEGIITNTASVTADEPDPNPDNNEDSVDVEVQDVADLGVTKSSSPSPGVGEDMTYTINVINNGPADTSGVQIQDSLPQSVDFVSAAPSQGNCNESGNVVTCNLGNLADGASATVEIEVVPREVGSISNVVTVTGADEDPYEPNDSYTLNTTVQHRADLSITKTDDVDPVEAATELGYRLTVTNHGPSVAEGVVVADTLPPDVTFVSASGSQGTCGGSNSNVNCNLGRIGVGATATIDITLIPRSEGTITNRATVNSSTTDPDPSNNTANQTTVVEANNAYIVLDQICGEPGDSVALHGFGWPAPGGNGANNYQTYVEWAPQGSNDWEMMSLSPAGNPFNNSVPNWKVNITIPAGTEDGTYVVRAVFDRSKRDKPAPEDTAIFQIPCPAPDLIVSDPVLVTTGNIVAGEPVVFTADVENVGNLDAVSQFFTGLYFNPSPAPSSNDTHIDEEFRAAIVAVNGLAANATKTVTFTVESGFSMGGTHQVYAVVDSDPAPEGVIDTEHVETNNISNAVQVQAQAAPTPTPTVTPSPTVTPTPGDGPSPTPSVTPSPTTTPTPRPTEQPGRLAILVYNEDGQPQANVELNLIDESDSTVVDTAHSSTSGTHLFEGVAPGTYTVTACIRIENVDYYAFVSGITVNSGTVLSRVLFLEEAPGGCV